MLSSEFNATIDQIVPRKIETLWARWRRDSPRYINYAKLGGLPDSPAAIASLEFARMHVHPAVLNHSIRTYYYSIALLLGGYPSKSPDAPQIQLSEIRETIFLSSILHDVGTSNTIPSLSAHTMSFEFHGGIAAHYHLTSLKQPLEAAVVGDVVESIFLHTSPFENGFCSTPVQLLNLSTWLDIIGLTPQLKVLWHEQTIKEIQEAYPRLGLSNVFASLMQVEIEKKPGCICTQKDPTRYYERIRGAPGVDPSELAINFKPNQRDLSDADWRELSLENDQDEEEQLRQARMACGVATADKAQLTQEEKSAIDKWLEEKRRA